MFRGHRNRLVIGGALAFFIAVGALPFALQGETTPPWVQATRQIAPASLVVQPVLSEVSLSAVATPVNPAGPPATVPASDAVHMSALVAAEDLRLRILLHHVGRLTYPVVMPVPSGRPTLILPGPASYTIADLESAGAVVPLRDGTGFALEDSVLVAPGASLKLGGGGLQTLLLDSSPSGFTSLVTWDGTLVLAGDSAKSPLTITGWDSAANRPAVDGVYGRPYIRSVGGRLDLTYVRISSLGFWSGRTGGVAWTGISSREATGSATSSSFTGNTYGAFLSRADQVKFTDDLFESNELDGLRLHRSTTNAIVIDSAAARNGGNGFVVSRGATGNVLRGDLAINNGGNGFLINGQSLGSASSPSGNQASVAIGTIVAVSEAMNNARTGILVEGGAGTTIQNNIVCAAVTGIAVRLGATDTWIAGNDVRCGSRIAIEIGPAVTGTTIYQNRLEDARIGLLIRNSPGVRIIGNRLTGMTLFGISVRGTSPGVVGDDNVIAGRGFQPIDTRGGANAPTITNTDLSGWSHRSTLTFFSYLRYHPIMTTWVIILLLVAFSWIVVRFRKRAPRPYSHTAPWQVATSFAAARAAAAAVPAAASEHAHVLEPAAHQRTATVLPTLRPAVVAQRSVLPELPIVPAVALPPSLADSLAPAPTAGARRPLTPLPEVEAPARRPAAHLTPEPARALTPAAATPAPVVAPVPPAQPVPIAAPPPVSLPVAAPELQPVREVIRRDRRPLIWRPEMALAARRAAAAAAQPGVAASPAVDAGTAGAPTESPETSGATLVVGGRGKRKSAAPAPQPAAAHQAPATPQPAAAPQPLAAHQPATVAAAETPASPEPPPNPFWNWLASGGWHEHDDELAGAAAEPQGS